MLVILNHRPNPTPYTSLLPTQSYALIPTFTLSSGRTLTSIPVAYKTWGTLNASGDNVLVICHALSGSADVEDWWRPLMGPGKTFDYRRFFVFCGNVLGSCYGSGSSLTVGEGKGERRWGPEFPATTVRDDIRIHKLVLDALGVNSVASVIGGSMGGMATLEWPLCTPVGYVKNIVPIATSAFHSAWGIAWSEAQRQCISADADFKDGWYDPTPAGQPRKGLATARVVGMLTYRSAGSFDERFGRRKQRAGMGKKVVTASKDSGLLTPPLSDSGSTDDTTVFLDSTVEESSSMFSAQGYLRYQGEKFLARFDTNCYLHMLAKMDSHDVTRGRIPSRMDDDYDITDEDLKDVFKNVPSGALVVSVGSDVLFRPEQQRQLARCLPDAKFVALESDDGHDGFLLEFEALGRLIEDHLREKLPHFYLKDLSDTAEHIKVDERKDSVFGEAEETF
ncbi:homoserine O-acetyltransferase [Aulographum hederae CBS 113979]|uniref:Homoserine O-acetyltransferase n=1 Tax=Aulographum hederae CBS 113979 TaxID=1176131 RepID=A0A6G1GY00_9PEZI|nr:homoserine O-acetyltransferase [Aulographum hederae CBS 113979]